jgi:hypothetical protein
LPVPYRRCRSPARLSANAAAAVTAKSFTIDGEAMVLGPDGLSQFEELFRRGVARIDLIEQMARICAISRSWTGRQRWRDCWRNTKACVVLSDIEDGLTVFAHACQLGSRSSPLSESLAAWLRVGRQPAGFLAYTQLDMEFGHNSPSGVWRESRKTLNFFLILVGRSRVQSILLA